MYQTVYESAYDEGIGKDLSPRIEIPVGRDTTGKKVLPKV